MTQELEEKLEKRYPEILSKIYIACGDGWYHILDTLCATIQNHVKNVNRNAKDSENLFTCHASQIKEKFGGLRFYIDSGDSYIWGAIDMAEYLSEITCEVCGSNEHIGKTEGWITTMCHKCHEEKKHEIRKWNAIKDR